MVTIELPGIVEHALTLEPRQVKGQTTPLADGVLKSWISVGAVDLPIMKGQADDPALKRFMAAQGSHAQFHLLHLSCSFQPGEDGAFEKAWLKVTLRRTDTASTPDPIAWSLHPNRIEHPVPPSAALKLTADLKIIPEVVEVGVEIDKAASDGDAEVFLQSFNELQSNPAWEFSRTEKEALRGSYRLSAVLRLPSGAPVEADISLDAQVKRKRWGIIPYRALFGESPRRSIKLQ